MALLQRLLTDGVVNVDRADGVDYVDKVDGSTDMV